MLKLQAQESNGVVVVEIGGSLDLETHRTFKKKIRRLVDEGKIFILFRMHELTAIDSSGIGAMLAMFNTVREYGGNVGIVGDIQSKVLDIIRLCGLTRVFQRFESVEKGIESFRPPGK